MKNPPRRICCNFCAADLADVGLLFVSDIGALAPAICDRCIVYRNDIIVAHRKSPALAETMIAAHNAVVEKARREVRQA